MATILIFILYASNFGMEEKGTSGGVGRHINCLGTAILVAIWVSENAIAGGRRGELLYIYRFKVWRGKLYSPSHFLQQLTEVFMHLRRGEGASSDH